jgi:hypothetical protein
LEEKTSWNFPLIERIGFRLKMLQNQALLHIGNGTKVARCNFRFS